MTNAQLKLIQRTFQGAFHFTRFVSNPELTITGSSIFFKTSNNESSYKEDGSYRLNGVEHLCYQEQTFLFTEDSLIIKNHIGKVLHTFHLKNDSTDLKDIHLCKYDRYEIDINIQSDDHFTISYSIQ